jgi:hypothetical protein
LIFLNIANTRECAWDCVCESNVIDLLSLLPLPTEMLLSES